MNKTVLGVTWLKLTANKFFIGLGIVIVLWGVIDSWLINQQQQLNGNPGFIFAFIFGPLTALILFGIHTWIQTLILKTKMMLRGDSHQWNIFADLLPWFVWVAVGLATWSVNEWYHPRPLSMTSPWDWMASLLCVFVLGAITLQLLSSIQTLILKKTMFELPWFVWGVVVVGLAITWGVSQWSHPRPLSMTSPWWMASLIWVFVGGVITLWLLSLIQTLTLKTKMMFGSSWFVCAAVGLAITWGVSQWFGALNPPPKHLVALFSEYLIDLYLACCCLWFLNLVLGWWRTHQPPFLALASVGIATGLGCGFIGGVFGTAYILSNRIPMDGFLGLKISSFNEVMLIGSFLGMLSIFVLLIPDFKDIRYWVRYSLWGVWLTSVFLMLLAWSGGRFNMQSWWETPWFWSVPITGASVGLLGVLIFINARSIELKTASKDEFMFFEQNPGDIRLKNQDNARCISLHLWWYRRRLTEWNPFWFTALVGIPLLSLFLISVPAVKDLQTIQQVFAEDGSFEYRSRIELLDPACMALKQFELEREQSPDWKKMKELDAKERILEPSFIPPQTEGQMLLCQALRKEIDEIISKNRGVWYGKQRDLLEERVNSSWEDGPLSKQFEQKKSDLQAAKDAAFSKLMAYIWNQCFLALGVGLVVDVMLLVGVAAWLNIRRSSKFPSSTQ